MGESMMGMGRGCLFDRRKVSSWTLCDLRFVVLSKLQPGDCPATCINKDLKNSHLSSLIVDALAKGRRLAIKSRTRGL